MFGFPLSVAAMASRIGNDLEVSVAVSFTKVTRSRISIEVSTTTVRPFVVFVSAAARPPSAITISKVSRMRSS